jgi:molybdopterin-guanine dinucleotide biosynthesis protein A
MTKRPEFCGLVLAGGQGRRMGGIDKAFVALGGKPLIAHVIERVQPQVDQLLISANGDASRFASFGARVLPDDPAFGSVGPLSGLFTALKVLQSKPAPARWIALFACDTPFFPSDLAVHLRDEAVRAHAHVAIPESAGRVHPTFALVRSDADISPASMENLGPRRAESWLTRQAHVRVVFDTEPLDPFFNLNTPEDLAAAETFLASGQNR